MPGLATRRSTPSRTSGPASKCPSTPSSSIRERRRSSSRSSATMTFSPRARSARVAAMPDSPSPYTRVLTASPRRVVEEEPHSRESGLGDPEPDDHLVLVPAEKLEVVVNGGHLEHPSSRELEDEDLDDDRDGLDDEQPAHDGEKELCLG